MDAHQLAPLNQATYAQEEQLQENFYQAPDNEGIIYTSLLSLLWSAINHFRTYEPKDPLKTIISNDENRPFTFPCFLHFLVSL